jgi:Flp pilus assembly pilin Flp
MFKNLIRFSGDERGVSAIEYALVLAFVAVAIIGALRGLDASIGKILKGWGPTETVSTPKPIGNPTNAQSFQNLTPIDVKNLYKKNELSDQMSGISVEEWANIYKDVSGNQPSKVSVKQAFELTDGKVSSGGNDDGVLSYQEFSNAILNESY